MTSQGSERRREEGQATTDDEAISQGVPNNFHENDQRGDRSPASQEGTSMPDSQSEHEARKSDLWAAFEAFAKSGDQQVWGIVFVAFPVVIFLLAWLSLGALGKKPPYPSSGQALYIGMVLLCIGFGLFSLWFIWDAFNNRISPCFGEDSSDPAILPDPFWS